MSTSGLGCSDVERGRFRIVCDRRAEDGTGDSRVQPTDGEILFDLPQCDPQTQSGWTKFSNEWVPISRRQGVQDVQDLKHVPLSAKLEVAGELNKADGSAQTSLLKIEDFKLHAATPLGKNGKFSGYAIATFVEKSVSVGQAYGQINDLIGEIGHGLLNLKVGTFDIALPFLSHTQRVIKQRYFAQEALGILGARNRGTIGDVNEATEFYNTAVELNGQVVGQEAGDITHRYAVGVYQPQGLNDQNRLGDPGFYATYGMTFLEHFTLGAIYKRDVVNSTLDPFTPNDKKGVNKWGGARVRRSWGRLSPPSGTFGRMGSRIRPACFLAATPTGGSRIIWRRFYSSRVDCGSWEPVLITSIRS